VSHSRRGSSWPC